MAKCLGAESRADRICALPPAQIWEWTGSSLRVTSTFTTIFSRNSSTVWTVLDHADFPKAERATVASFKGLDRARPLRIRRIQTAFSLAWNFRIMVSDNTVFGDSFGCPKADAPLSTFLWTCSRRNGRRSLRSMSACRMRPGNLLSLPMRASGGRPGECKSRRLWYAIRRSKSETEFQPSAGSAILPCGSDRRSGLLTRASKLEPFRARLQIFARLHNRAVHRRHFVHENSRCSCYADR